MRVIIFGLKRIGVPALVLFAALQSTMPIPVFAGVFSFITEIVKEKDQVYASERSTSLLTMDLPEPVSNPDPVLARGGGDISITDDGTALVPESGVSGTIADIVEGSRHPSTISVYVVRDDDTLSEIAEMFDVSVNTIRWANDIKGSIHEGQTLVILPVTGIRHTVAKGETLQSIAKKYKGDLDEIMQFNGLSVGAVLVLGEVLIVPDGEVSASSASKPSSTRGANAPSYNGYYLRPIVGGQKTQGIHGYNGVDLAAPVGTNVVASAGGMVIVARVYGWNGGYGTYVVISHANGTQTLYSHLADVAVSQGQTVTKGDLIGHIGMTGKTTGPHVHFEIRGAKNPF